MPFTPFHFGPSGCLALPLQKYVDVPVFVLANVVVDIEPLAVMTLGLPLPIHGYFHTLLIGSALGIIWGLIAWSFRGLTRKIMRLLRLPYLPSLSKTLISAILGIWFHVFLDALIYADVRPFYPFAGNPVLGLFSVKQLYLICSLSFIPAVAFYLIAAVSFIRKNRS